MPSPYSQLNDPAWLRSEYLDHRRTATDIAAEVGCPHHTVVTALRRHGIRRPPHRALAAVPADWLREQYVQRRRSVADIAGEVNLSQASVRRALIESEVSLDREQANW